MADGVVIKLVGDRKLIRKLERLEKKDARRAIRRGSRAGIKIVTAAVKAAAPVGATGQLRKAIRTRAAKRSRRFIGAVTRLGEGYFKGETFYGSFQEFGWHSGKRRGKGKPDNRKWIEGKHFMEEAAKRVGKTAGDVAIRQMRFEIEQAAKT